jgi:acetyl-CoA acetyltransferase family protein
MTLEHLQTALTHARIQKGMIDTAEELVQHWQIPASVLDEISYESQQRAAMAITEGKFRDEIAPIVDATGKIILAEDEGVFGAATQVPKLASMRAEQQARGSHIHTNPENASHTAGHASRVTDGGAAVLLTTGQRMKALGLNPLGRLVATASVGSEARVMGEGAALAGKAALKRADLNLADLVKKGRVLIEVNEAFASVVAVTLKDWSQAFGISEKALQQITNVNGGAIALGHPLAASGTRLPLTALLEARRRNDAGANIRYVLATMCEGGGGGAAGIFEVP